MGKRKISVGALENRISEFTRLHQMIDARIKVEETRPQPDSLLVRKLKQEKLNLKDTLHAAQQLVASETAKTMSAA